MGLLAKELGEIAQRDIRTAFSRAYEAIKTEQEKLKGINSRNPFLGLVTLTRGGINFSSNYRTLLFEHTDCEPSSHLYYSLGAYVELLQQEQISPRFPPKTQKRRGN